MRPALSKNSPGHRPEVLVARRMPQAVVDALETVEVDERDGDHFRRPVGAFKSSAEMVGKERPVWQAGQTVVVGIVIEP